MKASQSCAMGCPRGVQQDRNFKFRIVSPEQKKRISWPEKLKMDYSSYVKCPTRVRTAGLPPE